MSTTTNTPPRTGYVPAAPFRAYLLNHVGQHGGSVEAFALQLAELYSDPARVLRRLIGAGDQPTQLYVQLDTVDRICCELGEPYALDELYPYDAPVAA